MSWISVYDRLPEKNGTYLVKDLAQFSEMKLVFRDGRWKGGPVLAEREVGGVGFWFDDRKVKRHTEVECYKRFLKQLEQLALIACRKEHGDLAAYKIKK